MLGYRLHSSYELLFRGDAGAVEADERGAYATSRVLITAFTEIGIEPLCGRGLCFVNLTREFLVGDLPLPIRLVGVAVAGIRSAATSVGDQMAMFEPNRRRELNQAIDAIMARFGAEAVRRGAGRATKAAPSLGVKRGVD